MCQGCEYETTYYIIMMVTEVVTCVSLLSYLQLKVTNQQHNLDCTLTTTIWNQHSKRQTSGKISKRVAAPRDSKVLPRWRFLTRLTGRVLLPGAAVECSLQI